MGNNSKIKYICVSGYKKSGKDTFAKVAKKFGYHKYALADPLKEAIKSIFLFTDEQLNDQTRKEEIDPRWGLSPREAMTIIGTELLQIDIHNYFPKGKLTFDRDIFVKRYEYWENNNDYELIIISDLRLQHEYDFFKKRGAKFILINRDIIGEKSKHESENTYKNFKFDYVIDNNKSIAKFVTKSYEIINEIVENEK